MVQITEDHLTLQIQHRRSGECTQEVFLLSTDFLQTPLSDVVQLFWQSAAVCMSISSSYTTVRCDNHPLLMSPPVPSAPAVTAEDGVTFLWGCAESVAKVSKSPRFLSDSESEQMS